MCGIVGFVSSRERVAPALVQGIAALKCRNCNSSGVAALHEGDIEVIKDIGDVEQVARKRNLTSAQGYLGLSHTGYATHGNVSRKNVQPHLSCDGHFAVVHTGIISNYEKLQAEIQTTKTHFVFSEADTEIISHVIEEFHLRGATVEEAFVRALRCLEGVYAVAMISNEEPEKIFCARQKTPLLLGLYSETNIIVSDVSALLPGVDQTVRLEDGQYAIVSSCGYVIKAMAAAEKKVPEAHSHKEKSKKHRTKSRAEESW